MPAPKRRFWSAGDDRRIVARYPHEPTSRLARRLHRTTQAVYGRAARLGVRKTAKYLASADACRLRRGDNPGIPYRYSKGHVPANKGLRRPGWNVGRMSQSWYKKGVRSGFSAANWRPIGTILPDTDGYLRIKVREARRGEPTGYGNRHAWPQLHRRVWMKAHGRVPKGHIITFRNADKHDVRLENLECVSRPEMMRRHTVHSLPKPLAETIQLLGALNRVINGRTESHEEQDRRPA